MFFMFDISNEGAEEEGGRGEEVEEEKEETRTRISYIPSSITSREGRVHVSAITEDTAQQY